MIMLRNTGFAYAAVFTSCGLGEATGTANCPRDEQNTIVGVLEHVLGMIFGIDHRRFRGSTLISKVVGNRTGQQGRRPL